MGHPAVEVRSTRTGHRMQTRREGPPPKQTRDFPWWTLPVVAPLEIAARWRAKLEGRYG